MIIEGKKLKIALIHDHLAQDGGAERVLRVFCDMFPDAPIYTLLADGNILKKYYPGRNIETSIIQKLPGGVRHYKWYMPFMPLAVEFFDLNDFDIVLSDTSSYAKGVITSTRTLHICYCHTPTRYLWSDTHSYIKELKYNKYFKKLISLSLSKIRLWDRQAADRVDAFIANSKFIAGRIKKYYRRDATVIYPPVEVEKFSIFPELGDYFLIGGRLVPYKRFDMVIEAFNSLADKNYKLKIFGDGPDMRRLKSLAASNQNIVFLGRVDDAEKAGLYGRCLAFIQPQEEDFGITPIEANAAGRPVIAYRAGGAIETVEEGKTGAFFSEQSAAAISRAVEDFRSDKYDPAHIREQAQRFNGNRFQEEIRIFIQEEWNKFMPGR